MTRVSQLLRRTDVHDPPEPDLLNETTVSKALNPKREGETAPCTDEVACGLPKEDGNAAASNSGNTTCQYEESTKRPAGRVDCLQDAKLEYEN